MSSYSRHPRRPFGFDRVEAPTGREAAAFDRWSIDDLGVPHYTLMENAGRSAALVIHRLYPEGSVTALVGAGNNGADALVVLRNLQSWGRRVRAVLVADRPDEETVLHRWTVPTFADGDGGDDSGDGGGSRGGGGGGSGNGSLGPMLGNPAVLIDGILGTGIQGAPRARQARAIEAANAMGVPVVALDIPSGVDATTGGVAGVAVEADVTVAFGWPKLGALLHPGRSRTGRLIAVEIGFPPLPEGRFPASLITPGWAEQHRPRRELDTHKNAVGSLLLLAGRGGMAGAAIMAARAALRAGVGLLRVASAPENREIIQETLPEAIYVDPDQPGQLAEAVAMSSALAAGPGLGTGDDSAAHLRGVLEAREDRPLVLDADALNLAAMGQGSGASSGGAPGPAAGGRPVPGLREVASGGPLIVTPHPGEMARISSFGGDQIASDRVGVARTLAAELECSVLLKGAPSVVAGPDGLLQVDTMGSSDLAVAGMGDVLTGVVGSFLAQGALPAVAGSLGLYYSGRAAALADRGVGLIPGDVIEVLPDALRESGPGDSDLDFPFVVLDLEAAR